MIASGCPFGFQECAWLPYGAAALPLWYHLRVEEEVDRGDERDGTCRGGGVRGASVQLPPTWDQLPGLRSFRLPLSSLSLVWGKVAIKYFSSGNTTVLLSNVCLFLAAHAEPAGRVLRPHQRVDVGF